MKLLPRSVLYYALIFISPVLGTICAWDRDDPIGPGIQNFDSIDDMNAANARGG
jgi:hypothetical protein